MKEGHNHMSEHQYNWYSVGEQVWVETANGYVRATIVEYLGDTDPKKDGVYAAKIDATGEQVVCFVDHIMDDTQYAATLDKDELSSRHD
jgi:hypothetical protein